MKKTIYMLVALALNVVAIITLSKYIIISEMSSLSVMFMIILGFLSWSFSIVKRGEMPMNTGNSSTLNDKEIAQLGAVLEAISFGSIPLMVPFIFFFNDKVKAIVPSIILSSFVVVGFLFFRIVYGKKIKARLENEQAELEKQEKSEH